MGYTLSQSLHCCCWTRYNAQLHIFLVTAGYNHNSSVKFMFLPLGVLLLLNHRQWCSIVVCSEHLGYRVVCEQVSHHPPVSAFHVDSTDYTFHGAIEPKLKFWGKSVEITPKGHVTLILHRYLLLCLMWFCLFLVFTIVLKILIYCTWYCDTRWTKNQSTLACYNFDVHEQILIFFGRNVAEKVWNQMVLYFPASPN